MMNKQLEITKNKVYALIGFRVSTYLNGRKEISELTDGEFFVLLEKGEIYLQHSYNGDDDYFKDVKWFWGKDVFFENPYRIDTDVIEKASSTYKSVEHWIHYAGPRGTYLWVPKWSN
mgnify:FL=1